MNKQDTKGMYDAIVANQTKLRECPAHKFGPVLGAEVDTSSSFLGMKNRLCSVCGGSMQDIDIIKYARGYKAAGGNPDDVAMFCDGDSLGSKRGE